MSTLFSRNFLLYNLVRFAYFHNIILVNDAPTNEWRQVKKIAVAAMNILAF